MTTKTHLRLQVLSDTHIHPARHISFTAADILPDADGLVIAGDLGNPLRFVAEWIRGLSRAHPSLGIFLIPGNHEYYNEDFGTFDGRFMDTMRAIGPNVFPMQESVVEWRGVRFLGTTLWSRVLPRERRAVQSCLNDYRLIRHQGRILTPADTTRRFEENVLWLESALARHFAGSSVVISHHLPSPSCTHPMWRKSDINSGFASNLDAIILKYRPDWWIHGHTHNPVDTRIGETRVLCNPVGYPLEEFRRQDWKSVCIDVPCAT